MGTPFELLEAEVMKLSEAEREQLADNLFASLHRDDEIEAAWAAEIEKRVADIESGAVVGIPLDEAIERARKMLK